MREAQTHTHILQKEINWEKIEKKKSVKKLFSGPTYMKCSILFQKNLLTKTLCLTRLCKT